MAQTHIETSGFAYALNESLRAREKNRRFNAINLYSVMPQLDLNPSPEESVQMLPPDLLPANDGAFAPAGDAVVEFGDHLAFVELSTAQEIRIRDLAVLRCRALYLRQTDADDQAQILIEMYDAAVAPGAHRSPNLRERQYNAERRVLSALHDFERQAAVERLRNAVIALRAAGGDPAETLRSMI